MENPGPIGDILLPDSVLVAIEILKIFEIPLCLPDTPVQSHQSTHHSDQSPEQCDEDDEYDDF